VFVMSDVRLIEAVTSGERGTLKELLAAGADVNQQDEHGWTPLNWAAGRGDAEAVRQLLEHGADALKTGRDQRTPYMIALAAGHAEVVKLLRTAEDRIGNGEKGQHAARPYCKAYQLGDLRRFPAWPAGEGGAKSEGAGGDGAETSGGEETLYLHQDFTVTQSIWHGEDVVFAEVTPEWKEFCSDVLDFKVPDDLDLIVSAGNAGGDLKLGSVG
jgi:hypothetical protein